jgi:subtilisin family serine protease
MSFVTLGQTPRLFDAIRQAERAGIVLVAGVGNKPKSLVVGIPAAADGVVAVGAVDRDGNLAPFSVTGPEVLVTAPGADIQSAGIHNGYGRGNGTSDSTAITAGVVALIRSKFPNLCH